MAMARRYRVRGRVQGVGYRYFALRSALRLGVRGWVRNLANGEVEAHAEGDGAALSDFRRELERGPGGSLVTEVIEEVTPPDGTYSSFEIVRG